MLRNDLTGSLGGQVTLGQSSTIMHTHAHTYTHAHTNAPAQTRQQHLRPANNTEMPRMVALRGALLMLSPTSPATSVGVNVSGKTGFLGTLDLAPPARLPRSDYSATDREDVAYSTRAWSVDLPWNWVRPGLVLDFFTGDAEGRLDTFDFAAPQEMVIHSIRLGMLCDAPRNDHDHYMLTEPEASGANYFNMVPLARLTMAIYEEVKFDRSFRSLSLSLYLSLSLSRSLALCLSIYLFLSLTLKSKMPSPSPSPSSL